MSKDAVFRLASMSKPVTGVAIMMLVEEGKVGLDDPITKYLSGLPQAWSGVTVRHLLTHTSGLPPSARIRGRTAAARLAGVLGKPLTTPAQ